ncbi:MAG: NUDIX domain-containing protein [Nocardioides sp.]
MAATALREAREESGLESVYLDPRPVHLDRHEVGFCHPGTVVHHLDVRYAALAPVGAEHHVSSESLDVRWWPVAALPELEDEMVELIELARHRLQSVPPSSLAPAE